MVTDSIFEFAASAMIIAEVNVGIREVVADRERGPKLVGGFVRALGFPQGIAKAHEGKRGLSRLASPQRSGRAIDVLMTYGSAVFGAEDQSIRWRPVDDARHVYILGGQDGRAARGPSHPTGPRLAPQAFRGSSCSLLLNMHMQSQCRKWTAFRQLRKLLRELDLHNACRIY